MPQLDTPPVEVLLQDIHALETLLDHPGWRLLVERLNEQARAHDRALHEERVDNLLRMQTCQTTCKVLRGAINTPTVLLTEFHALLNEGGDNDA